MRFTSAITAFSIVSAVVANPMYVRSYSGNVGQVIGGYPGVVDYPGAGYPGAGYPGSGYPGAGSNNGGSGSNNGGSGSNNGGSGSNNGGSGSNNGGSGSNNGGSGGQIGKPSDCGLAPGQKAALTPLVNELKLTTTVNDLKHLVHQITDLLGDTLQESAITSVLNIVDSLVAGLGLGGLDLKATVDSVTSILYKQVPCLVDTLLPSP